MKTAGIGDSILRNFLDADSADFSDIQETGLIGSLEKMGTREAKKMSLLIFALQGFPLFPRPSLGIPALRGFQRSLY